ncbi:MAG: hypothetical protein IPH84_10135 [Bacteroidales bacterium]|nr:hypothetical protein [Bacteroidales bacterium]
MKAIFIVLSVSILIAGCGKLTDDSDASVEVMNYHDQIIKSYDTIIVIPYSDDGGSYYPRKDEACDSIDYDNDGVLDFLLYSSHEQRTGQSPHAWYIDRLAFIRSINPDYTIALSPSIPEGINNFTMGDRVNKSFLYSEKGFIYRDFNDVNSVENVIHNAGEIFIGIRKENGYHKYAYGFIQMRFIGYIILQRSVLGSHWTGCQVVPY